MGAVYDTITSQNKTGAIGSNTIAHACGGDDRGLLVLFFATISVDLVSGVTYNGTSMTQEIAYTTGSRWLYIYSLQNPDGGSSYNVDITLTGAANLQVHIVSLTGVKQSGDAFKAAQSGTATDAAPTIDVASASGEIVVDITAYNDDTNDPTADETEIGDLAHAGWGARCGCSYAAGNAPTKTMSWTLGGGSETWWSVGISVAGIPPIKNTHALL